MVLFVLVFLAIFATLLLLRLRRGPSVSGKYRKGVFMTAAETSFLKALTAYVGQRALIFAKVRLADLATPAEPYHSPGWYSCFNRISAKHLDFVLCDHTLIPICAIELDDSSHAQANRQARDKFVDDVLADVGLPLIRIRAAAFYSPIAFKALDKHLKVL
jgi:uncharacterized protein (DUF2237 family)